ncbi:ABC transporter permease [Caldisericum exile]|uniref:Molybdate/tungstate ABC transporter permease protein n=1 Tax=Caldisericum exile (strain DSM 21853 / NBRC 104410 / AZM16c01) TaxID=511051 RepID=A0A7U6JE98_CALEA|nr:ABC transporter permease [Caldisericum exile]BAL80223.1 putative molybdate/tungstate ABC transporter permease protein [Caldisericum exile AZM16c01]
MKLIFKWALGIIAAISILFVVLPLLRLITYPKLFFIVASLKDPMNLNAIFNSIFFAFISSLLSVLFGIPLSYLLGKGYFGKIESIVEAICDTPLATPHIVAGIALLLIFGKDGVIGKLLYNAFNLKLMGTGFAVIIAMMYLSFPFFVDTVKEGFRNVDKSLENASRVLGAKELHTFFLIDIPLVKGHIISGFLSAFARAISEFGAVIIVAYYPMTAPIRIYDAYTQYNLETSISVAATLLAISLLIFAILRIIGRRIK